MKKEKEKKDLLKLSKREKDFSTLAKNEGKGAGKRAKREEKAGYRESAKDSRWEQKVATSFARIRAAKADRARKKAESL